MQECSSSRMGSQDERRRDIFFELFESLPRQGPGNRSSTAKALALCTELPASPDVLDLGCGTGAQTLDLAEFLTGRIIAIDSHTKSIERLRQTILDRGLTDRVTALVADMAESGQPQQSFDLVW